MPAYHPPPGYGNPPEPVPQPDGSLPDPPTVLRTTVVDRIELDDSGELTGLPLVACRFLRNVCKTVLNGMDEHQARVLADRQAEQQDVEARELGGPRGGGGLDFGGASRGGASIDSLIVGETSILVQLDRASEIASGRHKAPGPGESDGSLSAKDRRRIAKTRFEELDFSRARVGSRAVRRIRDLVVHDLGQQDLGTVFAELVEMLNEIVWRDDHGWSDQ